MNLNKYLLVRQVKACKTYFYLPHASFQTFSKCAVRWLGGAVTRSSAVRGHVWGPCEDGRQLVPHRTRLYAHKLGSAFISFDVSLCFLLMFSGGMLCLRLHYREVLLLFNSLLDLIPHCQTFYYLWSWDDTVCELPRCAFQEIRSETVCRLNNIIFIYIYIYIFIPLYPAFWARTLTLMPLFWVSWKSSSMTPHFLGCHRANADCLFSLSASGRGTGRAPWRMCPFIPRCSPGKGK